MGPLRHITGQLAQELHDEFQTVGYTIGGRMVFPGNVVDGKITINGARGFVRKIADRMDLTLECIRLHYLGQPNPLGATLTRYGDFFALFGTFRGYVDFFLLQDLVRSDAEEVRFFMDFDNFATSSVPADVPTYLEFRRLSIEFVHARNRRIDDLRVDVGLAG